LVLLIGAAGYGKSHVLNEVRFYLKERVLVGAYTASAAHLIGGDTIHGMINLRPNQKDGIDLQGKQLNDL
jgi:hypothetical protein